MGSPAANAANLVVNTLTDDTTAGDSLCTLREAISAANQDANFNDCVRVGAFGADTITFSVTGTIVLGSTLPNITDADPLTIDGAGQKVTISGNNAVRLFIVDFGAALNVQSLTVANGNFFGLGGAIFNSGTLRVVNSTFSANTAEAGGGAISNDFGATLEVINSTFSGNSATFFGGAIRNQGTATVTNTAFSGNSAGDSGGGIFNDSGTTTLRNSLLANSPAGGNCGIFSGAIADGGGNLSDDGSCGFTDPTSNNNTPAGLDPDGLKDNGGPTQTIALVAGSMAIDMGVASTCAAAPVSNRDQRGFVRPVDGDGDASAVCDIGAFEFGALPPGLTCNGQAVTSMGTAGSDNLVGTNGNDVIAGLGGNDNISAGGGNDTVCGGEGNDNIRGGSGNDTLLGEGGHDNLSGGNGSDSLDGGADTDSCSGGAGTDTVTPECELVGGVP